MHATKTHSNDPFVIETDRFILRPLRRSDAGLLALYMADKRVAQNTCSIPHPLPPGTAEQFIERHMSPDAPRVVWIIDGADHDLSEVMGMISLQPIGNDQVEISYWVAPSFWGTGIARGALAALVDANPLQAKTYFAEIFQDNTASARVVTANGFEYIGDAQGTCPARGGTVDTWTYLRKMD